MKRSEYFLFPKLTLASAVLPLLFGGIPAHAQWVKGDTYYGVADSIYTDNSASTVTTVPTGTVTATSNPTNSYPYNYWTEGQYLGGLYQDYNWTGGSSPGRPSFTVSDTEESSGAGYYASSSTDHTSGSCSTPAYSYDDTYSERSAVVFAPGNTSTDTTEVLYCSLDADSRAAYPASASATAKASFGDPSSQP